MVGFRLAVNDKAGWRFKGNARDEEGKDMKKIVLAASTAAILTGCVAVRQNDGGESNVRPYIVKDKVHEKYEVGKEKVKATDSVNCLLFFIRWGSKAKHIADMTDASGATLIGRAKNGAYAIACDAADCDALVGTKYKVTARNFFIFQRVTAELTGYPANLTGVEIMPADENTPIEQNNNGSVRTAAPAVLRVLK